MTLSKTNHQLARQTHDIAAIQIVVADQAGLTYARMLSRARPAPVVLARQLAMALCREMTAASYPDIARAFGDRNHSTVIYACRIVVDRRAQDPGLEARYTSLRAQVGALNL